MSEWKTYRLGEICEVAQGLAINSKTNHLFDDNGLPLLRITDLINNKQTQFINETLAPKQSIATYEDIIYTRTGQVGLVFKNRIGIIHNNCFKVIPNKAIINSTYLYWFLFQENIREIANSKASGSVQKDLPHSAFKSIEIDVPDLPTQIQIASILSSLDDKIELNFQMNQTLEAMAQAIFKEWFVNFNFPGFDGELVDGLPKGWRKGKLNEVMEIKYGKDHKQIEDGAIPVYGSGGIMRYGNRALYEKDSILIPRKGTLSNLFYVSKPFWSVDTMFYTKIKNETDSKYLFFLLKKLDLASMNVGSAVPSLTTEVLNKIEIIIPAEDVLRKFEDIVSSFFKKIESNKEENQTLTQIRDIVLPKLMNRKLLVKE